MYRVHETRHARQRVQQAEVRPDLRLGDSTPGGEVTHDRPSPAAHLDHVADGQTLEPIPHTDPDDGLDPAGLEQAPLLQAETFPHPERSRLHTPKIDMCVRARRLLRQAHDVHELHGRDRIAVTTREVGIDEQTPDVTLPEPAVALMQSARGHDDHRVSSGRALEDFVESPGDREHARHDERDAGDAHEDHRGRVRTSRNGRHPEKQDPHRSTLQTAEHVGYRRASGRQHRGERTEQHQ